MIPLPEYADWFVLLCVVVAGAGGYGWWWRTQRQESDDAKSWDKFNDFMAFVEKGKRGAARGFTLIELLIVISIMVILVALTATMMRPDIEGRRVREAARTINVYLASARNRATETGKPCGVTFRNFGAPGFAMNADQCEVPPSYSGETQDAMIQVISTGANTAQGRLVNSATVFPSYPQPPNPAGLDTFTPNMVRPGDRIQLNHQGPLYEIISGNGTIDANGFFNSDTSIIDLLVDSSQIMPWKSVWATYGIIDYHFWELPRPEPTYGWVHVQPIHFRIFRAPVKGFAQPLQLPASAVVDLSASGVGNGVGAGTGDFTILFSPNGAVECVYDSTGRHNVVEPIYLLVGKRERVENTFVQDNPNEDTLTNYQDLGNRWVMVNPQTGAVSTEVVGADTTLGHAIVDVPSSRELARQAVGVGGR